MNGYDRIAPYYDRLSQLVYGKSILDSQCRFISLLKPKDKVLIIGGGTGQVLDKLAQLDIPLTIDFIEPSEKMIYRAKSACHGKAQLNIAFNQIHYHDFDAKQHYNCICCFYFLDLFDHNSLVMILKSIHHSLDKSGMLLLADFQIVREKLWQKSLSAVMHAFFKLTTDLTSRSLKDIHSIVLRTGFTCSDKDEFFNQFIFSAVYKKNVSKNGNHS